MTGRASDRIVGLLFCLLTAGCVGVESKPPVTGATQGGAGGVEPVVQPATPSTTPPPNTTRPPTTTGPTTQSVAKTDPPVAKTPAKIPASQSAATGPGKQEASPPLDLASLEQRLRSTKAIGVFTKISLKNQVDDLLTQFRAFHQGQPGVALTELRERYNLLLLKVLSLLQGSDPGLANAIAASREPIWGLLADPVKFATL